MLSNALSKTFNKERKKGKAKRKNACNSTDSNKGANKQISWNQENFDPLGGISKNVPASPVKNSLLWPISPHFLQAFPAVYVLHYSQRLCEGNVFLTLFWRKHTFGNKTRESTETVRTKNQRSWGRIMQGLEIRKRKIRSVCYSMLSTVVTTVRIVEVIVVLKQLAQTLMDKMVWMVRHTIYSFHPS